MATFGQVIRRIRVREGISLRYAGKCLSMNYSALSRIENSKASPSILIHTFRWAYLCHLLKILVSQQDELRGIGLRAIGIWENGKKKNRQARQRDNNNRRARK
jgi:hypothetical protein